MKTTIQFYYDLDIYTKIEYMFILLILNIRLNATLCVLFNLNRIWN